MLECSNAQGWTVCPMAGRMHAGSKDFFLVIISIIGVNIVRLLFVATHYYPHVSAKAGAACQHGEAELQWKCQLGHPQPTDATAEHHT